LLEAVKTVNSITVGARSVVVGLFLVGMPLLALPQVGSWLQKQDLAKLLPEILSPAEASPPPQLVATGPEQPVTIPVTAFMGEAGTAYANAQVGGHAETAIQPPPADAFPGNAPFETPFDTQSGKTPSGTTSPGTASPATASPGTVSPYRSPDSVKPDPVPTAFKPAPPLSGQYNPTPQPPRAPSHFRSSSTPSTAGASASTPPGGLGIPPVTNVVLTPSTAGDGGITGAGITPAVNTARASAAANQFQGQPWHIVAAKIQTRLRQLGAQFFELSQTGENVYRCRCEIPLPATPVYRRPFESSAADPLEAMSLVLHAVEKWSTAARPPANAVYRQSPGT